MTQHGAGFVTCPECRAVLPDLERQWVGHEDGCRRKESEMSEEPLDACVSCGALVPERQTTPYPGHHDGCALRGEWLARELHRSVELPPAAGPWIRVDSGERPGDGECVIVVSNGGKMRKSYWDRLYYVAAGDICADDEVVSVPMSDFTHWARVYLPRG